MKGYGRLSFHPIPCGTALFGHVTSGATCTACSQVGSGIQAIESLSLAFFKYVSYLYVSLTVDVPRLDSCSMGLANYSFSVST